MFKKLLTVLLCIVMSATLFAGCSLISKDQNGIDAQAIAVIDPITFAQNGETYYTSDRITITRKELKDFFIAQNGAQYLQQGVSAKEILESWAPYMMYQEMILLEGERMFQAGEMKKYNVRVSADAASFEAPYTQKQFNESWQSAYWAMDTVIYNLMVDIADDYGYDKPAKVENGDKEETPPWPVREPETENGEEFAEPWTAESVYSSQNDVLLQRQATLNFLGNLIDEMTANPKLLGESDAAKLAADRARYDEIKGKKIGDPAVVDLYKNLRSYRCVEMKYYETYRNNMIIDSIQNAVMDQFVTQSEFDELAQGKTGEELQKLEEKYTIITRDDVQSAFDTLMSSQKNAFSSVSAYSSAVKADSDLIVYRPYNVNYYYVKHILVPFSDAQKAQFATGSLDSQGLPVTDKALRARLAKEITSFEHVGGYDYGSALSIDRIRTDINKTMKSAGGSLFAANREFDDLIYKYNTDPGIVSKTRGYPMQYNEDAKPADSPNGMVAEFEEASAQAYKAYKANPATEYGKVYECVSDFGIHFVMVSDVLETGAIQANIGDYTSAAETQTIYEKLESQILTARKNDYFTNYANSIRSALETKYADKIHRYESVWNDLAKELEKEYAKA